ncbi:MAG: O-antigen ligase family protein, partial [Anaerolineae bacterium]
MPARPQPWLEAGWLLAAVAVPLAVNVLAVQPFEPAKVVVLRALAGCLAVLWLAGCLARGRSPWRELRDHPLLLPALGVAGAFLLATLAAPDRQLSLWGSYERGQGLVTQLSYLLLFLVPAARLRTAVQARRLLAVMAATAVPLSLLGVAQAADWQIPGLLSDARSPVHGTLGRSNFLGAYLALLLPLTLALAATARRRAVRLALACLAVADLGLLALTQARSAWLAAVTGLAVFGLLLAPIPSVSRGRLGPGVSRRARGIAGVLLAGGVLAAAGLSLWLGRAGGSAAARLSIWRASLDLIARRPLTGWGPDGLGLAFPRVYPPELVYYQGRGIMVDRAHNLALDWLTAAGVVGLLAGAALFYAFFRAGLRGLQRQVDPARRTLLAGCLAAVAGGLAGNLLAFDVTATASTTWLLLALLPALIADRPLPREDVPAGRDRRRVAALLALPALIVIVGLSARPQLADVAAHTAARRAEGGDLAGAVAGWERAIALWPPEPAYRLSLAWLWLQAAEHVPEEALP